MFFESLSSCFLTPLLVWSGGKVVEWYSLCKYITNWILISICLLIQINVNRTTRQRPPVFVYLCKLLYFKFVYFKLCPLKYTLICWSFLVWSRHLEKLKNPINMSGNYLRYFKTCLMALILSLSKTFSRLLMLCVCTVEWLKQCEDSSHCSLWEKSSGNFKQSDSSTKTKNLAPI